MTKETEIRKEADRLVDTMARLMGGRMERLMISLSQGEFGALRVLSQQDEGVTSSAISREMSIGPGGVANLLKSLEKKGYIVKETSSEDRRANSVRITAEGRAKLEERSDQVREYVLACLREIGPDEARVFNDTLNRVLTVSAKFSSEP